MLKFNRRNKRLVIPVGINPSYNINVAELYNVSDANVEANDILEGMIAYGKDGKIVGTLDVQSEKEESYQEGYEFGYNEGNNAGYRLGYDEGNEAGIEIGKAEIIEGMNDATITAGTVFKGEIGYGKDGERIVGDFEYVEGFNFDVIGYNTEESNEVNRSISDNIAYSKTLYDRWNTNARVSLSGFFMNDTKVVYAPNINLEKSIDTNATSAFSGCSNLKYVPLLNTNKITNMTTMFNYCQQLTSIPLFDTSNVTNMNRMLYACSKLTSVPHFNTSNVTDMYGTFYNCDSIITIPEFDLSNVTNANQMCGYCDKLENVPNLNTSKVTNYTSAFDNCQKLVTVGTLDMSSVDLIYNVFNQCRELRNVAGLTNCGKGFKGISPNNHNLRFSNSAYLTRQSCINIFNTIYDMTQTSADATITLHSTTKALLSDEDIAIATSKGWTIS